LGGYEFESAAMVDFFAAEEAALGRGDLGAATELNLKMWVDGFQRGEGEVNGQVREQVKTMQLNIFSQPDVAGMEAKELIPSAIEQLETIDVPTLVIIGDKDVAEFQSLSTLIAEKIEGSRHVIMPGTAHLPSMEKPEEFNQIVMAFL
jgi:pimeloyl-ACP methyl ester carboxylesterase